MRKELVDFSDLTGKIITKIEKNKSNDEIVFITSEGEVYKQHHTQDCCENVFIEDICGDLESLIGHPILRAEEVSQRDKNALESGTWTFYKLVTIKGYVTIRWYGSSNGYYSENVDFVRVK